MLATPGHDGTETCHATLRRPLDWRPSDHLMAETADSSFDVPHVTVVRAAPGTLLALPEHYEPAYAYPLILWLPDESQTEDEAVAWLERIGGRNHVAVGLRPSLFAPGNRSHAIERFQYALRRIEAEVLLHPQRRYVAGTGYGGRTALEWLMERPDRFAGAIAIDATSSPTFAARVPVVGHAGRRVLWAQSDPSAVAAAESADLETMKALGIGIEYWSPEKTHSTSLGRWIDQWILTSISTAIVSH